MGRIKSYAVNQRSAVYDVYRNAERAWIILLCCHTKECFPIAASNNGARAALTILIPRFRAPLHNHQRSFKICGTIRRHVKIVCCAHGWPCRQYRKMKDLIRSSHVGCTSRCRTASLSSCHIMLDFASHLHLTTVAAAYCPCHDQATESKPLPRLLRHPSSVGLAQLGLAFQGTTPTTTPRPVHRTR